MITVTTQEYISSTGRLYPESRMTPKAFIFNFLIIAWNPTHLPRVLGQLLGDPLHCELFFEQNAVMGEARARPPIMSGA